MLAAQISAQVQDEPHGSGEGRAVIYFCGVGMASRSNAIIYLRTVHT